MPTTVINPTVSLTNTHGTFTASADTLHVAVIKTASWPLELIKERAAKACGRTDPDVFRAEQWLEVLIMWIDSTNHPFPV